MFENIDLKDQKHGSELSVYLEVLAKSNRSLTKDFEYLSGFNTHNVLGSFQEETEALEGAHVTKEGINNKIRQELQVLSERKLEEAEEMAFEYNTRHRAALEKLESRINAQNELSSQEVAQIALRNNELKGEIRGKLHQLNSGRDIESEFKNLSNQSKYDKTLAGFLSKHYYLFLDRVNVLNAGELEKSRTINSIKLAVEKINRNSYSEKELALLSLRDHLRGRSFSVTGSKRNIEQQARALLDKYK